MKEKRVIRVGVANNFNCTENEFNQLKHFQNKHIQDVFFINCNVNTKLLSNINNNLFKSVITINPNISFTKKQINKLYSIERTKVSFIRVKYIPNNEKIDNLIVELKNRGYKVVITLMRFATLSTLQKYSSKQYYHFKDRFFKLKPEYFDKIEGFGVDICDKNGIKCARCGLCSELVTGEKREVFSLNLSESGVCAFNCPDCFAKRMQSLLVKWGYNTIDFDHIKKNMKQKEPKVV
jgi:hypothetical protein